MVPIEVVVVIVALILGVVGLTRGPIKELITTSGLLMAMFALAEFGPLMVQVLKIKKPQSALIFHFVVFLFFAYFAYHEPAIVGVTRRGGRIFARVGGVARTALGGLLIGLLNGYLVAGNLWYYLNLYGYPLPMGIIDPTLSGKATAAINYLPPNLIKGRGLAGLLVGIFLFVIVVVM